MKRSVQKHYYNRRHNTRPLPDLSPGQDILFLSPMDQTSYRHNRQHIRPINTDPPSPLSRPYMHTTPQSHNNSIVWGPQNISGPPQPLSEPKVVWNMKMPSLNDTPTNPQTNLCKTTHHNCPYSRPHSTKPSKHPHNPISGPPPLAELCLNKLLMHLISRNGIAQPSTKTIVTHQIIPHALHYLLHHQV